MADIAQNFRRALAMVGIVIRTSADEADSASPSITTGAGAPSAAEPNGSLYLRNDGTTTTTLYSRVSAAWGSLVVSSAAEATAIRAASVYASGSQTGTGAEQIFAHGLVTTPALIIATATAGHNGAGAAGTQAVTITYGAMSATELRFTVSSGATFRVHAVK